MKSIIFGIIAAWLYYNFYIYLLPLGEWIKVIMITPVVYFLFEYFAKIIIGIGGERQ